MGDRRKGMIVAWVVPLIIGLVGLDRVLHSPSYELYRAVDVVQLLGSGICFGATLVGVIFMFRAARS